MPFAAVTLSATHRNYISKFLSLIWWKQLFYATYIPGQAIPSNAACYHLVTKFTHWMKSCKKVSMQTESRGLHANCPCLDSVCAKGSKENASKTNTIEFFGCILNEDAKGAVVQGSEWSPHFNRETLWCCLFIVDWWLGCILTFPNNRNAFRLPN